MSARLTNWPAVTATLLSVRVPAPGRVVILTASRLLAGLSLGSVKPKSDAAKVYGVLIRSDTALSAPAGAAFTEARLNVMVLGDWSRSTPPLAVPPLSCTWKVKLA